MSRMLRGGGSHTLRRMSWRTLRTKLTVEVVRNLTRGELINAPRVKIRSTSTVGLVRNVLHNILLRVCEPPPRNMRDMASPM